MLFLSDTSSSIGDVRKIPLHTRAVALSRALGAKQIQITKVRYYSPPLSAVIIVLGMIIFVASALLTALCLTVYYSKSMHAPFSFDILCASVRVAYPRDGIQSPDCHAIWLDLLRDPTLPPVCIPFYIPPIWYQDSDTGKGCSQPKSTSLAFWWACRTRSCRSTTVGLRGSCVRLCFAS